MIGINLSASAQGCGLYSSVPGSVLERWRWRASCEAKAGPSLTTMNPRLWAMSRLRLWERR